MEEAGHQLVDERLQRGVGADVVPGRAILGGGGNSSHDSKGEPSESSNTPFRAPGPLPSPIMMQMPHMSTPHYWLLGPQQQQQRQQHQQQSGWSSSYSSWNPFAGVESPALMHSSSSTRASHGSAPAFDAGASGIQATLHSNPMDPLLLPASVPLDLSPSRRCNANPAQMDIPPIGGRATPTSGQDSARNGGETFDEQGHIRYAWQKSAPSLSLPAERKRCRRTDDLTLLSASPGEF